MNKNMNAQYDNKLRRMFSLVILIGLVAVLYLGAGNPPNARAQGVDKPASAASKSNGSYFISQTIQAKDGASLDETIINGPSQPPTGYELDRRAVTPPASKLSATSSSLIVPAFNWSFGCSATAGAMIAGYYDRNGFPDIYTGSTNGGMMPLDNSSWPVWTDGIGTSYGQNPLIASRQGLDGRATRGSVDDYWVAYNSTSNDPYMTNGWTQHTWGDAIGDYMKTSQAAYENPDGATVFYNYTTSPTPLTCDAMATAGISARDGTYGRKLFYEAKGYTVTDCYNQKTDNNGGGFTFALYKAEIDAGRPVMLNLAGHTVVGVGYNDTDNTIYLHDTWDYATHSMTWGGSYSGLNLLSVSIVNISKDTGWLSLGPQNQSISALAIGPEPPAILYAGTASGVFISPNGGASWVTGNTGLTITHIHSLAIDPVTPTTLYAGTWSGLFKSTNAGESWNASQTGLTSLDISSLAIDPKTPTTLYAGTTNGAFKSTDGGANWSAVNHGLTVAFINTLAIDPITPATLYAGTKGGGIFKSTNGAGTWSAVNSGLSAVFVNSLAIDPTMPVTLYAGTEGGGMFKSTNAGASWSAINTGLAPVFINSVVIDPLATTTLYVGTKAAGAYKSSNGGASWSPTGAGISNYSVNALAINALAPAALYAGTESKGVFSIRVTRPTPFVKRSPTNSVTGIATNPTLVWETNSEAASYEYCYDTSNDNACSGTWTRAGTNTSANLNGLSNNTTYYWQVRADSGTATVYADAGAWWSFTTATAANNWTPIGPAGKAINTLTVDPLTPTTLYAGTFGDGVFKSTNSGQTWNAVNTGLPTPYVYAMAIDPATPTTLYMGGTTVYKTTNGGQSWITISDGLPYAAIHSLAIDPITPTTLYAGMGDGSVYKSTNSGQTWSAAKTGLSLHTNTYALAIDPVTSTTLYAGKADGVYKSTNGGQTWSAVNNGLTNVYIITLAIHAATPTTLYAGTASGGVFKSTNAGASWSAANAGLTDNNIRSLVIDPATPTTIYAGTYNQGVFKSTNSAASWNEFNPGVGQATINALAIDPTAPGTLYAGTENNGVRSIQLTRSNTFTKLSPANSASGIAVQTVLSWETSSGASGYEYCYDTIHDAECNGTWISAGTKTNAALSGLNNNTTYYWQVRAISADETTPANNGIWWKFTTIPVASVSLNIHPTIQSVTSGQNFNVSIEVRAGAQPVDGAAAYVNFDPTYLQVVSVSAGNSLPMLLQNTFDNTSGQVRFSAGTFSNFPTHTFTLATVTFKALAQTSNTPITFADVSPRRSDITFGGSSVLNSLGNGAVEITNTASINGSITLQGRPASPDSKWSVPLSVSLTTAGSSQPAYTFTPTTDSGGKFTLTGIVPGTYQVRVKHSHTLQNLKTVTLAAGGNTIDFGTLLEGDANNDNAVSLIDFSILATTYSKCQGTAGYDSRADFNGDTCITLLDFSLLVSNYGKSGATLAVGGTENPIPTRQTNEAVSIVVDPATNRTQMGKTFTVTIRVQAGSGLVDGAQVSLDFDPTKLQVKKMTGNTSVLPQVLLNAYDNSTGTIDYAAGTLANFPAGEINLVQIEFEAIAKTPATPLTFHYGAPRNTEVTFAGGSVLNGDSDGMISVDESYKVFLSLLTK